MLLGGSGVLRNEVPEEAGHLGLVDHAVATAGEVGEEGVERGTVNAAGLQLPEDEVDQVGRLDLVEDALVVRVQVLPVLVDHLVAEGGSDVYALLLGGGRRDVNCDRLVWVELAQPARLAVLVGDGDAWGLGRGDLAWLRPPLVRAGEAYEHRLLVLRRRIVQQRAAVIGNRWRVDDGRWCLNDFLTCFYERRARLYLLFGLDLYRLVRLRLLLLLLRGHGG